MPITYEPFEEFEIARCIYCFILGEYLIVAGLPDVNCKLLAVIYHHLTPKPNRYYQTRSFSKATPFFRQVFVRLEVEIEVTFANCMWNTPYTFLTGLERINRGLISYSVSAFSVSFFFYISFSKFRLLTTRSSKVIQVQSPPDSLITA